MVIQLGMMEGRIDVDLYLELIKRKKKEESLEGLFFIKSPQKQNHFVEHMQLGDNFSGRDWTQKENQIHIHLFVHTAESLRTLQGHTSIPIGEYF